MSTAEQKRSQRLAKKAAIEQANRDAIRDRTNKTTTHAHGQSQVSTGEVFAPSTPGATGKGARTVTVACKLPHGLRLRLQRFIEMPEQVAGGGSRLVKRSQFFGDEHVIKGFAQPHGHRPDYMIIGDFALTPGIPKDFFEQWLEQNASLEAVKNRLIFAHHEDASVVAFSKEHAEVRSGLEPLQHDGDPRATKPQTSKLTKVEADSDRMKSRRQG